MRIDVDRERCDLHAQCALTAPDLFHINDDGVLLHADEVPEDWRELAESAAALCPTGAISVSAKR
jgi:ferredoxin